MKPNIIYLLSDQHNHRVMGNSGDSYARTPNLDSLYARGTALDSCYCAAPLCVPSRSSMPPRPSMRPRESSELKA